MICMLSLWLAAKQVYFFLHIDLRTPVLSITMDSISQIMHVSSMIHLMVMLICMGNSHSIIVPCAVSEVTVTSVTAVTPGDC